MLGQERIQPHEDVGIQMGLQVLGILQLGGRSDRPRMIIVEFFEDLNRFLGFFEQAAIGDLADVSGLDVNAQRVRKPVLEFEQWTRHRQGLLGSGDDPGLAAAQVSKILGKALNVQDQPVGAFDELADLIEDK